MSSAWRVVGVLAVAVAVGGACGRTALLELPPEDDLGGARDLGGVRDLGVPEDLAVPIDFGRVDFGRVDFGVRDLSSPRDLSLPRDLTPPPDLSPPPRDLSGVDLVGFDLAPPPVDLAPVVDLAPPPDLLVPCPGPCDDNNPCTVDACDMTTGRCVFTPAPNDTPCDDGDFCSVADRCIAGRCVAGAPRDCNDGNSCTVDFCSSSARMCLHQPRPNGAGCDDGNRCTSADRCVNAVCVGIPRTCNDGNVCTIDRCEPSTGACVFIPTAEGVLCNDNNPCTSGDTCTMGRCVGQPVADGLQCVLPFGQGCCTAGVCAVNGC